jgi:hypothetical protein
VSVPAAPATPREQLRQILAYIAQRVGLLDRPEPQRTQLAIIAGALIQACQDPRNVPDTTVQRLLAHPGDAEAARALLTPLLAAGPPVDQRAVEEFTALLTAALMLELSSLGTGATARIRHTADPADISAVSHRSGTLERAEDQEHRVTDATARIAAALGPDGLAGFIGGLGLLEEDARAAIAIGNALRRGPRDVAELIRNLLQVDSLRAAKVVEEALHRWPPDDAAVLACLLDTGIWPECAQVIWDRIVAGLAEDTLITVVDRVTRQYGVPSAADGALRQAATTYPVERVSALTQGIRGTSPDSVKTVLVAVATYRPVREIFALATALDGGGYSDLAAQLLEETADRVPQRRDSGEAAEFIDRLETRIADRKQRGLARGDKQWAQRIAAIIEQVVRERKPVRLMDLIAGLVKRQRYHAYHTQVEQQVAASYGAAELAALPLVRGRDNLPAVLEITLTAIKNPRTIPDKEVPAVIRALATAGATAEERAKLLAYAGFARRDALEVATMLSRAGMGEEARWVKWGENHREPRPRFLTQ